MLKLYRLTSRVTLTLSLWALFTPFLAAQAGIANSASTPVPLLSQASFTALDAQAKSLYLQGLIARWRTAADGQAFAFVRAAVDSVVSPAGDLRLPPAQAQPFGRAILLSYRVSGDPTLYRAARQLRDVFQPQQDKADISAAPFLADFGVTFNDVPAAEQAANILLRVDTADRDLETGLLRGSELSRNTLYALDLLETINRLPIGFHHRRGLTEALNKTVSALIARHADRAIWQTPGQPTHILLLNAYIVASGVRFGELAESDSTLAKQMADLAHSRSLSPEDEGAALLSQSEEDQVATQAYGQGSTVLADAWFDSQPRPNAAGKPETSPSKWNDNADHGLSFFGYAFQRYGLELEALHSAPNAANLSSAQIYVIVSQPETPAHLPSKIDADAVEAWVKEGGVLVLMQGGAGPNQISMLNTFSDRFGMHFQPIGGASPGAQSEQNIVSTPPASTVFSTQYCLLLKPVSRIEVGAAAHPILGSGSSVAMAVASVGRGTVLAIADPWLWNQYVDGRGDLPQAGNYTAAIDLAGWLLKQTQQ